MTRPALCAIVFFLYFPLMPTYAHGQQVIEFGTDGCIWCERMKPTVSAIKAEGYDIRYVHKSQHPQYVEQFRVTMFPTYVAIHDGKEVGRREGAMTADELRAMCQQAVRPIQTGQQAWEKKWPDGLYVHPEPAWQAWGEPRVVRVRNSEGGGFVKLSGSIVDLGNGDKSYVLTCSHGLNGVGDPALILFDDGTSDVADVVAYEQPLTSGREVTPDCSLLKLRSGPRQHAFTISAVAPVEGQQYRTFGFPNAGPFRPRNCNYVGLDGSGQQEFTGMAIPGESGAAICDAKGQVVSVLHSCPGDSEKQRGVVATYGAPWQCIQKLLDTVLPGRPGVIVPNCPERRQWQPQQLPPPSADIPPPPVTPEPEIDHEAEEEHRKYLDELEKRSGARFESLHSLLVKIEANGGCNCTPADLTQLYAKLDALSVAISQINVQCPATPQPSAVVHYVLVADEGASYWRRVGDMLTRAREVYSQIRTTPIPSFPIGQVPQLVAYENGKPLGAFKGPRDVENALALISKGETPKP